MYEKTFLNDYFELSISDKYPIFEQKEIDYEIFGGMIVMELTKNHIDFLKKVIGEVFKVGDVKDSVLTTFKYFETENRDKSRLIITHIFPNSYLSNFELLNTFEIISKVNDVDCFTLNDYRKAILKSKGSKYIYIKTESNSHAALDVNEVIESEPLFSDTFKYSLSISYNNLLKKTHNPRTKKKYQKKGKSVKNPSK